MTTPFRADHIGSLVRPEGLRKARVARVKGQVSAAELHAAEDAAILQILEVQKQAGIDVFTDGEYRRERYTSNLQTALDGVRLEPADPSRFPGFDAARLQDEPELLPESVIIVDKVRLKERRTAPEVAFMKQHSPGPFKATITSAWTSARTWYRPGVTDSVYPSRWDLLDDLVAVTAAEMRGAAEDGAPYVQLDAPGYTQFMNPDRRQQLVDAGLDPDEELDRAIAADNACLRAAKRPGVTVGIHVCRGMWALTDHDRVGTPSTYEPIAERVFGALDADTFLLEYTEERAGSLGSLRFVPRGKIVTLGIVSVRNKTLETVDYLRRRIDEAAKYVPIENLAISPQCGFSGANNTPWMSWDEQRAKLERMAETARQVWR